MLATTSTCSSRLTRTSPGTEKSTERESPLRMTSLDLNEESENYVTKFV